MKVTPEDIARIEKKLDILTLLLDPLLSPEQAAEYAGIHVQNMYRLLNKIPHSKPGGKKIYIQLSELQKYLRSNPISSDSDINDRADEILTATVIKKGKGNGKSKNDFKPQYGNSRQAIGG